MMTKIIITILVCLLSVTNVTAQDLTESEVTATMYRAFELNKEKKHSEALQAFLLVGKNTEQQRTEDERQVYVCSQTMACLCYELTGHYKEGYKLAKKLIAGKLNENEKKDVYHQYVLNGYMIAVNLIKRDKNGNADYPQGRKILLELAPYADTQLKAYVLPKIPLSWYFEGAHYFESLRFNEALMCFKKALEGFHQQGITRHEIAALQQIAATNYFLYNINESIKDYKEAFTLAQRIHDVKKQIEISKELYNLSCITGDLEETATYSNFMDSIIDITADSQVKFGYYNQKGNEAQNQKMFKLAEQWFLKGKAIAERQDSTIRNANKYLSYTNLRNLYVKTRQFDEALKYGYLTLSEYKRQAISNDKKFYLSYIPLAFIYSQQGDRKNCFKCIDSIFVAEPYINEPRELYQLYMARGNCYNNFKEYNAALTDFKKANEIISKAYPSSNEVKTSLYPMMGGIEHQLNHFEESEYYYTLYAEALKNIYGNQNLKYINAQIFLANAQGFANHIKQGCENYTAAISSLKNMISIRLPYMNTSERESFWEPLSSLLTKMTPYALKSNLCQTEYTQSCYDALVMSKSFLLDSERSLYEIIKDKGSEIDLQTYLSITAINNQVKEWEKNYSLNVDSILKATDRIKNLEKVLMKKVGSYKEFTSFLDTNYKSVKDKLKSNEVLIDFTDYISASQGRRYAAYIINKKQEYPLLVSLCNERQIDSLGIVRPDMFYDKDYSLDVIKLLWNPIRKGIAEGTTIYYVPSHLLFRICLESLPLDDGTLLGDHYNFIRLSSARELTKVKNQKIDKQKELSAVLYGGLKYDLDATTMTEDAKKYNLSSFVITRGGSMAQGESFFNELPGSKIEIDNISDILSHAKCNVTSYTGTNGTEESFLNLHQKSPQILHIATHGFYFTPENAMDISYLKGYTDAMFLSGLIMSGGNAAWRGKEPPKGVLGGVLTANNIARLDLGKTDLVVLSTCQSGEGKITSEGLYGLQRAFKKAGVGTIVMALWSVSDKITAKFMAKFYESLIQHKWNKQKAFKQAKTFIRKQYDDPYYWAAFVMLD